MNKKLSVNERKLKNSLTHSSSLEKETRTQHERIAALEAREQRAINIASYMEYQLRVRMRYFLDEFYLFPHPFFIFAKSNA